MTYKSMSQGWACLTNYLLFSKQICRNTHFKGVLDFDLQPTPGHEPWSQYSWHGRSPLKDPWSKYECFLMSGWRDIPTYRNFNRKLWNSTNETESNEWMNEHTNGRSEKRKYIPFSINAGGGGGEGVGGGGGGKTTPFFYLHFLVQ